MFWKGQVMDPDHNPFKTLWHDLKRTVRSRPAKNTNELNRFLYGGMGSKIPPHHCVSLVSSYRKHLVEVVAAKMQKSY